MNQVSQTYTFWVPAGTGTATGGTTWNNSTLDPGLLQASAPAFASQNVSVVEDTGALETSIDMPSYNPNVPALSLNYDSLAANALPIIVSEHALSPSLSTPSQVSAQLTFDGTAGTTYYYSTSATGGSVLDHVTYDSFGNIVTQTNSTYADRFLFAGMEYDSTTGIYYDHARYYNSVVERYVSQDPKGFGAGDTNLYRYVGDAPTEGVDTTGYEEEWKLLVFLKFDFGYTPPTLSNSKPPVIQNPVIGITGTTNQPGLPGGGVTITKRPKPTRPSAPTGTGLDPVVTWPISPPGFKPPKDVELELKKLWTALTGLPE